MEDYEDITTVKPLYYGQQGDRNQCPYYRGVRFREVPGLIWISVSQGLSELSVIELEVSVRRGSTVSDSDLRYAFFFIQR